MATTRTSEPGRVRGRRQLSEAAVITCACYLAGAVVLLLVLGAVDSEASVWLAVVLTVVVAVVGLALTARSRSRERGLGILLGLGVAVGTGLGTGLVAVLVVASLIASRTT
ncbi:hypothetical protein [Nocardioides sp. URHA0020]|uniref:hypothetical protein n=1 Tax=Nocardioides sp. URHA0020 TaxID=1380392 RepID=UPI000491F57C|nr:hypothetical protein [Nocardioides sp. URHA0020]